MADRSPMEAEAMDRQIDIMGPAWDACRDQPTVARKLRIFSNAMYLTTKNEGLAERDMLNSLCLLTGMAGAAMQEAAELLEEE